MLDDSNFSMREERSRLTSYTPSDTDFSEQSDLLDTHFNPRVINFVFTTSSLVSVVFWVWAFINNMNAEGDVFDFGVITFALVLISSILILCTPPGHHPSTAKANFSTVSYSLVTLNYAGGATLGLLNGFVSYGAYCTVFTFLWAAATVYCRLLITEI